MRQPPNASESRSRPADSVEQVAAAIYVVLASTVSQSLPSGATSMPRMDRSDSEILMLRVAHERS